MSRRNKLTKGQQKSIEDFRLFLNKYYSVPYKVFDTFRELLIYYSLTEAEFIKVDRIYSGIAIMLWKRYDLSGPEIMEALRVFDATCGSVIAEDKDEEETPDWTDLMTELKEQKGIVVHSGPDNRLVCECEWEEEIQEVEE